MSLPCRKKRLKRTYCFANFIFINSVQHVCVCVHVRRQAVVGHWLTAKKTNCDCNLDTVDRREDREEKQSGVKTGKECKCQVCVTVLGTEKE